MTEFNEQESTNQYLVDALILARKANEILTENNRRLERLLVKAIKDLKDADRSLDQLKNSVDNLTNLVTAKVVKS
jgi:hypothetical protein